MSGVAAYSQSGVGPFIMDRRTALLGVCLLKLRKHDMNHGQSAQAV